MSGFPYDRHWLYWFHGVFIGLLPLLVTLFPVGALAEIHAASGSQFLQARSIGPATIGGRVMAIESPPSNSDVIYVGGATSGLWKSKDGGILWHPISDDIATSSIGAITLDPSDPDTVWLGTGEPKPRYGTGFGKGVYKSKDGGKSWIYIGLSESERIQSILIDPTDSDTAYVAVIGPAWYDSEMRGVFKTRDGGSSWKQVLFTNLRSGAASLIMDPQNPKRLFAAMWDFRREPWKFTSGGVGSGMYVTEDGGESWSQLGVTNGLPDGTIGRVGLAIAPNNPDRIYALIESEQSGLYRSDDGGNSWFSVSTSSEQFTILSRPWYFQKIEVDPHDSDIVYHMHGALHKSVDGGMTFHSIDIGKGVHSDHHDLWIDPEDSSHLLLGTDGGVYETNDQGGSWRFINNLPMAQMYNVNVDMEQPFNIYTSIQDQANWRGPSMVPAFGGIRNESWTPIAGRESGMVLPVTGDPRFVYGLANMGHLYLTDTLTGMFDEISPAAPDVNTALRRNNAAAIALDPFDADVLYYGSQFVHRTTDRGKSWDLVSPDLTTNDPDKQQYWHSGGLTWENFGGVTYTTIVEIAPSRLDRNIVWVGTDDGNIQLTTDGGRKWRLVSAPLAKHLAPGFWVADIKPSLMEAGKAWVVANDFRRGDRGSYLFLTKDFGNNWERLPTDSIPGPLHSIEQDPEIEDLMFLGAEFGMYISFDRGRNWAKYEDGMPTVAVRGTVIHPRDMDLVIATFGRGAYIVDDIGPLRVLAASPELRDEDFYFFNISPVQQYWRNTGALAIKNGQPYAGRNRSYGALLTFHANERMVGKSARISIATESGTELATFPVKISRGLNRFIWDLRPDKSSSVPSYYSGWPPTTFRMPEVVPGRYNAIMEVGRGSVSKQFIVLPDPRLDIDLTDRKQNFQAVTWLVDSIDRLNTAYKQVQEVLAELERRVGEMSELPNAREMLDAQAAATVELSAVSERIHFQFEQRKVMVEEYEETMRREWPGGVLDYVVRWVWPQVTFSWNRPSSNDIRVLEYANSRMRVVAHDLNDIVKEQCGVLNELLTEAGLNEITTPEQVVLRPLMLRSDD